MASARKQPAEKRTISLEEIVEAALPITAKRADEPGDSREGLAWARDAFWAYSALGERVTKDKAGTAARYALWKFATQNMETFIGQLLPKAMTILDRQTEKAGGGAVEAVEAKAIDELQRILKAAIHEAAVGNV